jgi:hypothetical protein
VPVTVAEGAQNPGAWGPPDPLAQFLGHPGGPICERAQKKAVGAFRGQYRRPMAACASARQPCTIRRRRHFPDTGRMKRAARRSTSLGRLGLGYKGQPKKCRARNVRWRSASFDNSPSLRTRSLGRAQARCRWQLADCPANRRSVLYAARMCRPRNRTRRHRSACVDRSSPRDAPRLR